jgi:hypothetical protein
MTIIILSLTALYIYEREIYGIMDNAHPNVNRFNFKPFNCLFCLSFHLGWIISLITLNPIYLAMPLFYKIIQKQIS